MENTNKSDYINNTSDVKISQSLIRSSFENLNTLVENSKFGHRGMPKHLLKLWYEVRINALNMCLNDHLSADPTIECNDYYLDLIHENTKYYVVVNNVLKFEVEPEKLTAETIRWTAITISARCISQGGLICSL